MSSNAPISTEINQSEDVFYNALDSIDRWMMLLGLTWESPSIVELVNRLHERAGYTPLNPESARYALSLSQIKAIETKLEKHWTTPDADLPLSPPATPPANWEVVKFSDGGYDISRKSPLGNPFVMKDESERDKVCEAFRVYLWELHKQREAKDDRSPRTIAETIAIQFGVNLSPNFHPTTEQIWNSINYLLSARGRLEKLGCHCTPKRCHGDTIAKYLKFRISS